jgi:aminoglycoside phosphotransferase
MKLPPVLKEKLTGYTWKKHPYEEIGAEIYQLKKDGEVGLYLKIQSSPEHARAILSKVVD